MMTPQEKAKQLYGKFYGIPLYIKTVKECCHIAVNEIIDDHFFVDTEYSSRRVEYWRQVKEEIDKL